MEKESRNLLIVSSTIILISVLISLTVRLGAELFYHLIALLIGLFLLVKYRDNISKRDILTSIVLAAIPNLYALYQPGVLMITFIIIPTYLGALAAIKNYGIEYDLIKYPLGKSLAIILIMGTGLGLINLILPVLSGQVSLSFSLLLHNLILSLVPGVSEEIIFRFLFLGLTIHILKRSPIGIFENILCWLLMVVPMS